MSELRTYHPRDADIHAIDPETVIDLREVNVRTELPPRERMLDTIGQMNGNPYIYKYDGIVVKTSFRGSRPFQELLEEYLQSL